MKKTFQTSIAATAAITALFASRLTTFAAANGTAGFGVSLQAVATGNGRIVAVGQPGAVAVSSNAGEFWTLVRGDHTGEFQALAFGTNIFAAVGKCGLIRTSRDGFSWSTRQSGTSRNLLGLACGGGRFVAVGAHGTICISDDGARWKLAKPPTTQLLAAIAYGNGAFVAVGEHGTIITSTDGLNWRAQQSPTSSYYYAVAYGNDRFVVAGDTIVTSPDGSTWQNQPLVAGGAFTALTYGCGQFVATASRQILTSADGLDWTPRATFRGILEGVMCGEDGLVAVGWHRNECLIMLSKDGAAWSKATAQEAMLQAQK